MASLPRAKNGWAQWQLSSLANTLKDPIMKTLAKAEDPLDAAEQILIHILNRGDEIDEEEVAEDMRKMELLKPVLKETLDALDALEKKQEAGDDKYEAKDKEPGPKDKKQRQKDRKREAIRSKNVDNAENHKPTEQKEDSKKPEATTNNHHARVEDLDSSDDDIPPPFGPAWGDMRPVVRMLHHDDNGRSLHAKAKFVASLAAADKKDDEDEMERNGTKAEWERTKPAREAAQAKRMAAMKEYEATTVKVLDQIDPREWTEEERLFWETHHVEFTTGSLAILWGRIDASYQKKYGNRDP